MNDTLPILGESICPYCGVGCRLQLEGRNGRPERIRGVESAAANRGGICAKGALLGETIDVSDRLTQPQLRNTRRELFRHADWDTALRFIREILEQIRNTHGPDAIAFYGSGQLDTETAYLAGKLFKGTLGTNNTDSNSRLCMAAAVAGYRSSLGSDGPPTCYDDIDEADVLFIIGSNMAEAHPVTFDRIRAVRKTRPEVKLIVADPRRTATAREADIYLPVAPGGDIALLNALGRLLLEGAFVDSAFVANHTNGFEDYCRFLMAQDVAELCTLAGIAREKLAEVAELIGRASGFLSFY